VILKEARAAYAEAKGNRHTANVEAMYDAELALKKAESAVNAEEMTHLAYLAEKQSRIAVAVAERKAADAQRDEQVQEKSHVLIDAREQQVAAKSRELATQSRELEMTALQMRKSQNQLLTEQARAQQLQKQLSDLKGKKTQRGLVVTLGDVLFETAKAELLSGTQRHIESVSAFLKQNPSRRVLIEGHTDNRGSETYNLGLSERRANSVRFALIQRGIASNRMLARGFGENRAIASNSSETGRQQNRRVEITILNEGEILR
ncbi:OmpA family protein, partial [Candidatus Marithioploca araucensis]|nr:OmpA family protein [Candidatus Marithioploca araucensis]